MMGQTTSSNPSPRYSVHKSNRSTHNSSSPMRKAKSASTTTVPSHYAVQTDRKYNKLKIEYNTLLKEIEKLKHVNSDLQSENEKQAKMTKDLLSNQSQNISTIRQLHTQINYLSNENKSIESLNNIISSNEQTINELKVDLANAQQTILSMTSIVDVNQKLPTVDETLLKYQSIRDQQHADICTILKKCIKKQYSKWQKYYIAQILHEIMFNTLILTYNSVLEYKMILFNNISNELNVKFAIKNFINNDEKMEINEQYIENETNRILRNMLGAYFKNNYEYILKKDKIINPIIDYMISKCNDSGINNSIINNNELECMKLYVLKCCEISWIMILQDPILQFYPIIWKCKEKIIYNDEIHKKVLGSDRKCHTILYYVWPAISKEKQICGTNKIDVIVKNEFYKQIKEKRQSKLGGGNLKLMNKNSESVQSVDENIKTEIDDEKMIDKNMNDIIEKDKLVIENDIRVEKNNEIEDRDTYDVINNDNINVIVKEEQNDNNNKSSDLTEENTIIDEMT